MSKNYHLTPWPLGAILREALAIIGELRNVLLMFLSSIIYLVFVDYLHNDYNFGESLKKICLWFIGESYSSVNIIPLEFTCFFLIKLLSYFFFGLALYIMLTSLRSVASAIEKGDKDNNKVRIEVHSYDEGLKLLRNKTEIIYSNPTKSKKKLFIGIIITILLLFPIVTGCLAKKNKTPSEENLNKSIRAVEIPHNLW
ncbi:hypothetical protein [Flavivirga rizhaonensis]|uniref:Uncharacterized protein n=1 Tax=Flavivirga rizhaonensis TaxID=2559571 RepID=A0A4S1E0F5_9FLAO|nr:hypothetical protein [Flavivirga rizhaonensis]TGV03378.1 hypothetical protein EM932_06810 [Flavivirga rizhaonensis]